MLPTDLLAFLGSGQDLLIIAVLILLLFGGSKIPQLMRGLGRGMGEFKAGLEEGKDAMNKSLNDFDDKTRRPIDAQPVQRDEHSEKQPEPASHEEPATKS